MMMIEIPVPQSPSIADCHTILRSLFCISFPHSQEIQKEKRLRAEITMRSTGSVLFRQVLRHLTVLSGLESHDWCRVLEVNLKTWNGSDAHVSDGVYTIRQPDLWSLLYENSAHHTDYVGTRLHPLVREGKTCVDSNDFSA